MRQISTFSFFSKRISLLIGMCLMLMSLQSLAQTTATEEFENETAASTFSESGVNFTHTFLLRTAAGFGYNGSNKFLELANNTQNLNTVSAAISINNSLNPSLSYKINSFAAYVSAGGAGATPYNGEITVTGTPVGSSTAVSATISIASASGGLPAGQTRDGNGIVNGLNFTGTPLAGLYFTSLSFSVTDNNISDGNVGTRYLELDHINFTTQLPSSNQFSISDASITEGSGGTKSMTFTVSCTATSAASSVQVQSSNGTATAGSDYVAFPLTTVSFAAGGATSQTVNVTINGDVTIEPDETFNMTLSNPVGGTIFDGIAVGTILDDDNITETFEDEPAIPVSSISTVTGFSERGFNFVSNGELFVSRGNNLGAGGGGGTSTALDTRTGNGGSTGSVGSFSINSAGTSFNLRSIDVYTSNNDGMNGTTGNVNVTFTGAKADGSGSVSYTATIATIVGDNYQTVNFTGTAFENVQILSVSVTLGTGINYVALDNIRYGTVSFSGTQLSINDVSVLEGTGGGTTTATFTVTRSGNGSAFSVNVASSDVSATAGSDYVAYNATLNFAAGGPMSQNVTVTILRDALIEGIETFNMTLSGATNGVLYQKPVGIGTILDDDKVIENFEDETNGVATFSENSIGFSATNRLKVVYNSGAGNGSGSSKGYLSSGDNASGGTVGKITIANPNMGFKLLQLDMLTYKGISTSASIASGPVTFNGTLFDGSTVTTTKTITPTSLSGTGFQQNITFTGTPLDNVILTSLEFVAGGTITTIDIDNINYVAVTTLPVIEITDAANVPITNGGAATVANNTDFGATCAPGGSVVKTFTIKNTGAVNLTLSGSPLAVLGGTNANQFSITTQPVATVAANSSTTFTVSYTPTATGTHNATITLTNNDATSSPYVINIKGTANAALAISSHPATNTTACTGNPVNFTAAGSGSGTLSYQWYKGATALTNGATGTGSVISGATNTTLTITNPSTADNATNYNVRVSSSTGCTPAQSNNATLTVAAPATATATTTGSKTISSTNTIISDASCKLIATVTPSGVAPVSGNITATVTVQGIVPTTAGGTPYVQRHYDIVPSANPATATATLTLYFTQAEFTALNNFVNEILLPTDGNDAANRKANIRIYQFHGNGTAPGNYTGTSETIDPADNNIIYNTTYARWEITFNVTGFSGFYLSYAGSQILPLQLISFTGFTDGNNAILQWKTTDEKNVSYFEIERSTDAAQFIKVGQVNAGSSYGFTDKPGTKMVYYYRLKIIDKDGKYSYSYTVAINLKKEVITLQVLPNPFADKLMMNIGTVQTGDAEIRLTDISGKVLLRKIIMLQSGNNAITINQLGHLSKGMYILQVMNDKLNEMVKIVKGE